MATRRSIKDFLRLHGFALGRNRRVPRAGRITPTVVQCPLAQITPSRAHYGYARVTPRLDAGRGARAARRRPPLRGGARRAVGDARTELPPSRGGVSAGADAARVHRTNRRGLCVDVTG